MSRTGSDSGQASSVIPASERLDSWKEIAAYLRRDERTLRRWEIREGLPIRRERQKSKVLIYAYKSELDAWSNGRPDNSESLTTIVKTSYILPTTGIAVPAPRGTTTQVLSPRPKRTRSRKWAKWLAISAACLLVFGTAAVLSYMRWWRPAPPPANRISSLAVLPLLDVSSDSHEEYFADGMTELLTAEISHIKYLRVIATPSMMPYKTARKPLQQMAEELNVDAVIEGTVARTASRVRITLRLIETNKSTMLWTNTYERDLRHAFSLPRQFVQAIGLELSPRREVHLAMDEAVDEQAPDAYLKGNYYFSKLSCQGLQEALGSFQQAAAGAPNYALAHARLANTYFKVAEFGCQPGRALIAKARASAARALTLDPSLAEAHTVLGQISFLYDWDWWTAQSELKRATELNPNDALAHAWYGAFLFSLGKQSDALVQFSKARNLDPVPGPTTLVYAFTLYHSRWYDRSIEQFQRVIALYPDSASAYFGLAASYERKRMRARALKNYIKAKELSGGAPETLARLRNASRSAGLTGFWQKEMELAAAQPDACRSSVSAAHIGVSTQVLTYLERAYDARCSTLASLKVDPLYDRLRREPRFIRIMKRMGLPDSDSGSRARRPATVRSPEKTRAERTASTSRNSSHPPAMRFLRRWRSASAAAGPSPGACGAGCERSGTASIQWRSGAPALDDLRT